MTNPPRVTFLGLLPSNRLMGTVFDCARGLEHAHGEIADCRIRFEMPQRRGQICREIRVRLEVLTPGAAPIVVRHTSGTGPLARIAVLQVFDEARRQLEEVTGPIAG